METTNLLGHEFRLRQSPAARPWRRLNRAYIGACHQAEHADHHSDSHRFLPLPTAAIGGEDNPPSLANQFSACRPKLGLRVAPLQGYLITV